MRAIEAIRRDRADRTLEAVGPGWALSSGTPRIGQDYRTVRRSFDRKPERDREAAREGLGVADMESARNLRLPSAGSASRIWVRL